jgi:hypothetical protein
MHALHIREYAEQDIPALLALYATAGLKLLEVTSSRSQAICVALRLMRFMTRSGLSDMATASRSRFALRNERFSSRYSRWS